MNILFYLYLYKPKHNKFCNEEKDIKILLVDDEQDILEIVGYNLFSRRLSNCYGFENGKEAIAKAKKNIRILIIMDVMMPEMDGMEACENKEKFQNFKIQLLF